MRHSVLLLLSLNMHWSLQNKLHREILATWVRGRHLNLGLVLVKCHKLYSIDQHTACLPQKLRNINLKQLTQKRGPGIFQFSIIFHKKEVSKMVKIRNKEFQTEKHPWVLRNNKLKMQRKILDDQLLKQHLIHLYQLNNGREAQKNKMTWWMDQ